MAQSPRWSRARDDGFTLIEMLLVVVIIAVLAGMVIPHLAGRSEEARVARAQADIRGQLSLALDLFEQDVGRYPSDDENLEALITDSGIAGWKGPYLKGGLKPDPWGTPYIYQLDPEKPRSYVLYSAGPDAQAGSGDDVKE
jgi:general secretion pathway protein G